MTHPCYCPHLVTARLLTDLYHGHRDVASVDEEAKIFWLLTPTYYWVSVEDCLTASDASGGKKEGPKGVVKLAVRDANGKCWVGAFFGTVPEAECVGTAGSFRHGPDITRVHLVDATAIASVHCRVVKEGRSGIPIFTARLSNQMAVDWMDAALLHRNRSSTAWLYWVWQSSHLSSVVLHYADAAADRPCRPHHLCLPTTHLQLRLPGAGNHLGTGPVQESILAARKSAQDGEHGLLHRGHTLLGRSVRSSLALKHLLLTPYYLHLLCKSRDEKLPIMEPLRLQPQRLTNYTVAYPQHPCIFCGGPTETFFHIAIICHVRRQSLDQIDGCSFGLTSPS